MRAGVQPIASTPAAGSLQHRGRNRQMDAAGFGIFDHVERTEVPLEQLYEERLRLLQDADAAGVYGYHAPDHHAPPLRSAPSPPIFLTPVPHPPPPPTIS